MKTFTLYRKLLRAEQWYKNTLVFLPLLFSPSGLSAPDLLLAFLGFSCLSSITYISNDWLDRERDRLHPTKKHRPLASGAISGVEALIVVGILSFIIAACFFVLGLFYASILCTYFLLTSAYSLKLKHIPVLDTFMICANFVLRMMAGLSTFPTGVELPYFGFLFGFVLMFLTHKRRGDIKILGMEKAVHHKPVLRYYSQVLCYTLRGLAYALLFFTAFLFYKEGLPLVGLIALGLTLWLTSFIFVRQPELTSKPHYLLKKWPWDLLVLFTILAFIIFD